MTSAKGSSPVNTRTRMPSAALTNRERPRAASHTVGAARQWLGSCGKVDNGVVGVHLSYCAPGFQCLLDSELYLSQEWADGSGAPKKNYVPDEVVFRTKPQIALGLVDRALAQGVRVSGLDV